MRMCHGEHGGTSNIVSADFHRARHTFRPSQYFLPAWRVVSSLMRISVGCSPASLLETMPTCRAPTRFSEGAHACAQHKPNTHHMSCSCAWWCAVTSKHRVPLSAHTPLRKQPVA